MRNRTLSQLWQLSSVPDGTDELLRASALVRYPCGRRHAGILVGSSFTVAQVEDALSRSTRPPRNAWHRRSRCWQDWTSCRGSGLGDWSRLDWLGGHCDRAKRGGPRLRPGEQRVAEKAPGCALS